LYNSVLSFNSPKNVSIIKACDIIFKVDFARGEGEGWLNLKADW